MKKNLLGLIFITLLSSTAFAEDKPLNPWKHCGIGAKVFPENGKRALIANISWDLGTTAVSSNLSSQDLCKGSPEVAAAEFITQTYASLEDETAKGQGPHLNAMLDILGCSGSMRSNIVSAVQSSFAEMLSDNSYELQDKHQKAENYYNAVQHAAATCAVI